MMMKRMSEVMFIVNISGLMLVWIRRGASSVPTRPSLQVPFQLQISLILQWPFLLLHF